MQLYINTIQPRIDLPTFDDVQRVNPSTFGDRVEDLAAEVGYDSDPDPYIDFAVNLYIGEDA